MQNMETALYCTCIAYSYGAGWNAYMQKSIAAE